MFVRNIILVVVRMDSEGFRWEKGDQLEGILIVQVGDGGSLDQGGQQYRWKNEIDLGFILEVKQEVLLKSGYEGLGYKNLRQFLYFWFK